MTVDPLTLLIDETYSTLKSLLPASETAAVVDYPAHHNFGDSLIYLGQRQHLRRLGYKISYLGDSYRYSADFLRKQHPTGPIFLPCGGSLGDRYYGTQIFREQLLADFPERAIVQLPQSMDFTQKESVDRARSAFAKHSNFLLLLRDHVSLQKAREAFPETRSEFCPDLSFGAGWLRSTARVTRDLTMLLRMDSEQGKTYDFGLADLSALIADWGHGRAGRLLWNLLSVPNAGIRRFPGIRPFAQTTVEATYQAMAHMNLRRGRALLGPARLVLTDRLHAAVMAALMKKAVVVLENSYGKIAPIYTDYLNRLPLVRFARDGAEARELIMQMHAQQCRVTPTRCDVPDVPGLRHIGRPAG